jgi:uracil-DNA glycosylase
MRARASNGSSLTQFVAAIRTAEGLSIEVPDFDPRNGNENARFLFLLEAPGPMAVGRTGYVSFDNPDQTARNFKEQLQVAGIDRSEIAIWNIVPWYLGNASKSQIRAAKTRDVAQCLKYLDLLLMHLRKLECIVLVGSAARKAHVHLSSTTDVRILSCHHPSPRVKNFAPSTVEENIAVFRAMKRAVR